ncbi:NAD(P)H-dependent flavin oxidoreductase [Aliicoccus persicus]|uniref:Probable nitronate monooxygenase n=1 Tax=Aliicoccus persicus TaxID=930138 RepID=A0A662Z4U0_9STAP|nr:nitronate monooxygenase [Aliicoccus persicus]SEW14367.1 nitronate monooxygenase [Aliicoccus persicus]
MWNENQLTQQLKIKYPIIQAGMSGATTPELVAAVSNSGALGTYGAGYLSAEETREAIQKIKTLTDQPFAVNLFVPEHVDVDEAQISRSIDVLQPIYEELNINPASKVNPTEINKFEEQIEVIIEENVPICSFTFGIPSLDIIKRLKDNNVKLIGTATSVREAELNEEASMDAVVAQGSEAGGHRGSFETPFHDAMIGTMALTPQAADTVNIPVIAAGGIADARGIYASLILGAAGAQIGTLFLTTHESAANKAIKSAVLNSVETDKVITPSFSGKPARGIRNDFIDKMLDYQDSLASYPIQHALTSVIRKAAAQQNRPEYMALWSGQNTRFNKEQSTQELVENLINEIESLRTSL